VFIIELTEAYHKRAAVRIPGIELYKMDGQLAHFIHMADGIS